MENFNFLAILKKKKAKDNDIVSKQTEEVKEVHPIIKRQIGSLKNSLKSHGLSLDDIKNELENEDEDSNNKEELQETKFFSIFETEEEATMFVLRWV